MASPPAPAAISRDRARSRPPASPERTRWPAVIALGLAMLVVTSELTIAAVTLPGLGADLGVGPAATAWVLLAYALPLGAMAIPAGRWADGADVRAVFALATVGVTVTGIAAALAPTYPVLLGARVLQGLAAGLIIAVYMPIVVGSVRPAQRGQAIGFIVTIMTLGAMAGVPLGGLVADAFSWREVLLLKVPVLVVVFALGLRAIPRDPERRGVPAPGRPLLLEAALLGGAVALLLLAVDGATRRPLLSAGLLVVCGVLVSSWARLGASGPVLDLVRRRSLASVLVALMSTSFGMGLIVFLVPYFAADVLGEGPEYTGLVLLFFVGSMAAVSAAAGILADRYGTRVVAVAGSATTVAGMSSMITLDAGAGMADLAWRLALLGVGVGLFNTPANAAILAAAPPGMAGVAGGIGMTARTIALTAGPAVAASCWVAAGGGVTGFRAGAAVLTAVALIGLIALCLPQGDQHHSTEHSGPDAPSDHA